MWMLDLGILIIANKEFTYESGYMFPAFFHKSAHVSGCCKSTFIDHRRKDGSLTA